MIPSVIKRLVISLGVLVFASLLALFVWALGISASADLFLYDSALRSRIAHNPIPLNPSILRLDLNDSSEAALGEALDSRRAFADVLSVTGEAGAALALDFIFRHPAEADEDFAAAGRNFDILVHAVTPVKAGYGSFDFEMDDENRELLRKQLWHIREPGGPGHFPEAASFIMSEPVITASATRLGHIGVEADGDGVFRRTPLFYRWEDGVVPALSLAMAADLLGIELEEIEWRAGTGLVLPIPGEDPIIIPADEQGNILVPYTDTWADETYRISFGDAAAAAENEELFEELRSEFTGAVVIGADTTTAKRDFGITPFETVYPLSGIHAAVLSGILEEIFYAPPSPHFKILIIALALCLVLAAGLFTNDIPYHGGFIVIFVFLCTGSWALWHWRNHVPWFGVPGTLVLGSWLLGFVYRLLGRYREQLLLRTALGRYFPRALAERIAAEGKTELVPARKELTMLFADISSFTKWSSDKDAGVVHGFLSDYLENMAAIIFAHGGTVDKFMGDGLLAFFGDPFEQKDHAARCLNAAIAMQKRVAELGKEWGEKVQINLRIRIGINSGRVIVGTLGTKSRIEYTVIGSPVNLAQRMESNAPVGGILLAGPCWEKIQEIPQSFRFSEKRQVTAKGYDNPVDAYELLF
jgi:adenylate cyclase